MGNAASIEPDGTLGPAAENYQISMEPAAGSAGYSANTYTDASAEPAAAAASTEAGSSTSVQQNASAAKKRSSVVRALSHSAADQDDQPEEEVDTVDLLFQFIPYYGQGDASNDSIVRSALSSLSVEDIDKVDEYGNTLLLVACQYRCEPLVRIMLNKGADPNALNTSGACPLHFACYKESMSKNIAKLLLQNGANPEISETSFGCTPLHYCASTGDVDFCKMLISYGAHVGTYDYYQYTCVDYAREANMREAAVFLQKKMLMTASQGPAGFAVGKGSGEGNLFFGRSDQAVSGNGGMLLQGNASFRMSPTKQVACNVMDSREEEWAANIDPSTGSRYYLNTTNGECLWESDYLKRMASTRGGPDDLLGGMRREESVHAIGDADLLGGVSTPSKSIKRVESSGSMPGLIKSQLSSKRLVSSSGDSSGGGDPAAIKKLLNEAKMQSDQALEEQRNEHRAAIAEKDGKIAKLESEVSMLTRDKERTEVE